VQRREMDSVPYTAQMFRDLYLNNSKKDVSNHLPHSLSNHYYSIISLQKNYGKMLLPKLAIFISKQGSNLKIKEKKESCWQNHSSETTQGTQNHISFTLPNKLTANIKAIFFICPMFTTMKRNGQNILGYAIK